MFSGIVEEVGRVADFNPANGTLSIAASRVLAQATTACESLKASPSAAHASPSRASHPTPSSSMSLPKRAAPLGSQSSNQASTSTSNEHSNTTHASADILSKDTSKAPAPSPK